MIRVEDNTVGKSDMTHSLGQRFDSRHLTHQNQPEDDYLLENTLAV